VDELVKDICVEYLGKMPPDFIEDIFRVQITKLRGPTPNDKGFGAPLNIFLFQELQRLQNIIAIVRSKFLLERSLYYYFGGVVVDIIIRWFVYSGWGTRNAYASKYLFM
jgi:hypothetical protein